MQPSPQALAAELASKEGRASARTLARLLQHLLARDPAATRRGYVLDGWPRSLAQARLAFSPSATAAPAGGAPGAAQTAAGGSGGVARGGSAPADAQAGAGAGRDRKKGAGAAAAAGAGGKDGSGGPAAAAAGAAAPPLPLMPPSVGNGLPCPKLLPHWVIQLEAPRDELMTRVRALAAAEEAAAAVTAASAAAAAAAAAVNGKGPAAAAAARGGSKKAGGGGGGAGPSGAPMTHNNERDFARRYDAWLAMVQEESPQATARVRGCRPCHLGLARAAWRGVGFWVGCAEGGAGLWLPALGGALCAGLFCWPAQSLAPPWPGPFIVPATCSPAWFVPGGGAGP